MKRCRGFAIVELVVVISVLGVLVSLLLPAIARSREMARKKACAANLMQLGVALNEYHDAHQAYPQVGMYTWYRQSNTTGAMTWYNASRGSVLVKLLPYMEQKPLFDEINFEATRESPGRQASPKNHMVINAEEGLFLRKGTWHRAEIIPGFLCPSAALDPYLNGGSWDDRRAISCYAPSIGAQRMNSNGGWCTDYPGNVFLTGPVGHGNRARAIDVSGPFSRGAWAAKRRDITDGQSQVIAMGEILPNKMDHGRNGWMHFNSLWTATTAPINFPIRGIGEPGFEGAPDCHHWRNWQTSQGFKSKHQSGAQFLMCDGSTHFLNERIDYMTYQRLGDRRDGSPLGGDGWHR